MKRSELREEAVKILYSYFIQNEKFNFLEAEDKFVKELVNGVISKEDLLLEVTNKYIKKGWNVERLSLVDKAIIYVAIYEMTYTDTPKKVAINEAMELSKKYSDLNVKKMINAILDTYLKVMNNE